MSSDRRNDPANVPDFGGPTGGQIHGDRWRDEEGYAPPRPPRPPYSAPPRATGPCEHGNRWRQGASCRACWEYQRGREEALREREQLKDALEGMVEQYIYDDGPSSVGHMFMGAGEDAAHVLATLYPDEWIDTGVGARRKETTP